MPAESLNANPPESRRVGEITAGTALRMAAIGLLLAAVGAVGLFALFATWL